MFVWMIIIIILTVSMIFSYYILPDTPEVVIVHAYAILLVSLAVMYRVFKKMRARRFENLISELNYLRMKVAQFEQEIEQQDIEIIDQEENQL